MTLRSMLAVPLAACLVAVGLLVSPGSAAAAEAGPSPLTITVDKTSAVPGDTVTMTLTFQRPEPAEVSFVWLSVNPTYATYLDHSVDYRFVSTTNPGPGSFIGKISFGVWYPSDGVLTYPVPIPAGSVRTILLAYQVAPTSACGPDRSIQFYFYIYHESTLGAYDNIVFGPGTQITCPAG